MSAATSFKRQAASLFFFFFFCSLEWRFLRPSRLFALLFLDGVVHFVMFGKVLPPFVGEENEKKNMFFCCSEAVRDSLMNIHNDTLFLLSRPSNN